MTFLPMSVPSHFKCQRKAVEITAPLGCIREQGGKMLPKGLGGGHQAGICLPPFPSALQQTHVLEVL